MFLLNKIKDEIKQEIKEEAQDDEDEDIVVLSENGATSEVAKLEADVIQARFILRMGLVNQPFLLCLGTER